ncbi:MAG: hypothetical protein MJ151_04285, partial [Lachnospiraceae bacterium]|nr:hypothetical protein [Lachnospiraceae bacterium]
YEEGTKKFLKENVELDKNDTYTVHELSDIMNFDAYKRKFTMEAFVVSTNVNFVSRACKIDENLYNGHLHVLNNIIDYDYLHEKIRVQGGAYGAKMTVKENGCIAYFSYSDPKFVETDNVYKNTHIFINNLDMSKEDIDANIIGSIRKIDTYPLPYEKHLRNLVYRIKNMDNDYINNLRHEILSTTLDDMKVYKDILAKATTSSEFCAIVTAENQALAKEKYKIVKKIGK